MAVGRPPPGRHNLVMIGSGECLAGGLDVSDTVPLVWKQPRNVEDGKRTQCNESFVMLFPFHPLLVF